VRGSIGISTSRHNVSHHRGPNYILRCTIPSEGRRRSRQQRAGRHPENFPQPRVKGGCPAPPSGDNPTTYLVHRPAKSIFLKAPGTARLFRGIRRVQLRLAHRRKIKHCNSISRATSNLSLHRTHNSLTTRDYQRLPRRAPVPYRQRYPCRRDKIAWPVRALGEARVRLEWDMMGLSISVLHPVSREHRDY
jgi:hypothetical protein